MKKLLLLLAIISPLAYADIAQDNFSRHKALTLEALARREQILKEEKSCVQKSTNVDNLKSCFKEARQNRKEIDRQLRPKMP